MLNFFAQKKRLFAFLAIALVITTIAFTVIVSQEQQTIKQRASFNELPSGKQIALYFASSGNCNSPLTETIKLTPNQPTSLSLCLSAAANYISGISGFNIILSAGNNLIFQSADATDDAAKFDSQPLPQRLDLNKAIHFTRVRTTDNILANPLRILDFTVMTPTAETGNITLSMPQIVSLTTNDYLSVDDTTSLSYNSGVVPPFDCSGVTVENHIYNCRIDTCNNGETEISTPNNCSTIPFQTGTGVCCSVTTSSSNPPTPTPTPTSPPQCNQYNCTVDIYSDPACQVGKSGQNSALFRAASNPYESSPCLVTGDRFAKTSCVIVSSCSCPAAPATPTPGAPTPTSAPANNATLILTLNVQDVPIVSDNLPLSANLTLYNLTTNSKVDGAPAAQAFAKTSIPGRRYSANVSLSNLQKVKHFIVARKDNMIAKSVFTVSSTNETITVPTTTLVFGDINNDNNINAIDWNINRNCWKNKVATGICASSDFNGDGVIDQVDFNTLMRGWATWNTEGKE